VAETIRCPFCGGLNAATAQWCGQCLEAFPTVAETSPDDVATQSPLGATPEAPVTATADPAAPAAGPEFTRGAFTVSAEGITWTCPTCETPNSIDSDVCTVCGTTFAQMVHPEPEPADKDPNTAALISLFFPGAGHAYLGMWSEAIARAVVSLWAIGVAIIAAFASGQAAGRLITILFGVVAFALWGVAANDAYRAARREKNQVILKGRGFLFLVLGLLGVLLLIVVGSALRVR
jgi:hypothetical protein